MIIYEGMEKNRFVPSSLPEVSVAENVDIHFMTKD
jgi:hypothetical protein